MGPSRTTSSRGPKPSSRRFTGPRSSFLRAAGRGRRGGLAPCRTRRGAAGAVGGRAVGDHSSDQWIRCAEALIIGVSALWAACPSPTVERPARSTALWLGALTGVVLCPHLSALPLAVALSCILDGRRERARFVAATTAAVSSRSCPRSSSCRHSQNMSCADIARLRSLRQWSDDDRRPRWILHPSCAGQPSRAACRHHDHHQRGARAGVEQAKIPEPAGSFSATWDGALVATDIACLLLTAKHPDWPTTSQCRC